MEQTARSGPGWVAGNRIQGRWQILGLLGEASQPLCLTVDETNAEVRVVRQLDDEASLAPRLEEWRAWMQLPPHPHLARAYELVEEGGSSLALMEFVAGTHLGAWIGSQQLTHRLDRVLRFFLQICDGLAHARRHGVAVHGNLHARNCLVAAGEVVKVSDFGPARGWSAPVEGAAAVQWRDSAAAARRLPALAPERFDDPAAADARGDVYSLGVLLYEMLAGEPPLRAGSWAEYRRLHEQHGMPEVSIELPALKALLEGALQPEPARRLEDVERVAELARAAWVQAFGEAPPAPLHGPTLDAQRYLEESARLRAIGHPEPAWRMLEVAAEAAPEHPGVHWQRIALLSEQERLDLALEAYDGLLRVTPEPEQGWLRKGILLRRLEKNHSAMEAFDRALELAPYLEEAWFQKGLLLEELGRDADAIAIYEHLVRLNPHHAGALSNKAGLLFSAGMAQESLTALNQALEVDPDNAMLCFNKGSLLALALERFEEALPWLEKARNLDVPEAAGVLARVRQALLQQRQQWQDQPVSGPVQ